MAFSLITALTSHCFRDGFEAEAAIYKEGPWWRELGLQGEILSTLLPPKLSLPAPDTDLPLLLGRLPLSFCYASVGSTCIWGPRAVERVRSRLESRLDYLESN